MKKHFLIIMLLLLLSNVLKAEENIEELENKLKTAKGIEKAKILNKISHGVYFKSIEKSFQYANQAYKIAKENNDRYEEANSLFNLALCFHYQNDYKNSLDYYSQALDIFKKIGNNDRCADCYLNMGTVDNNIGQYDKAIEKFEKAIKIYEEKNNLRNLANGYNNIAISFTRLSNHEKAILFHQKSLKIRQKLEDKIGIAGCMINIGNVFFQWGRYNDALNYFQNALKLSQETNDKDIIGVSYANIGRCYREQKKNLEAMDFLKRALNIALEKNLKRRQASYMETIGMIYHDIDSISKAIYYLEKAQVIFVELNSKSDISRMFYNFGRIKLKLGKYNEAIALFNKSLDLAGKIRYTELIYNNYDYLSFSYIAKGNYKKGLELTLESRMIKDSIFNEENSNRLMDIKISYETEKKENENKLLRLKNSLQFKYFVIITGLVIILLIVLYSRYRTKKKSITQLTEKHIIIEKVNTELYSKNDLITNQNIELEFLNDELKEANASKDKFFLVISHELLNPIRWLKNVSDLLLNKVDKIPNNELRETIQILNESARESNQLLENLLHWARVNSGRIICQPEEMNINEVINDNILSLHDRIVDKQLNIKLEINEDIQFLADRNMLNSVVRNLLNNAVKFTNTGGEITIKSDLQNGSINIHVIDSGIGIKEEDLDKLFKIDIHFTTMGTNNEKGTGLGLILCKEYLERCGGKISVESEYSKGSKFSFSIPIQKP